MSIEVINAVLNILGKEENDLIKLKIEAKLNEILSYLNRDQITDEIFPSVCEVIAECLKNDSKGMDNVQSLTEGDMSVTFSNASPFFGKLDSFKIIKGLD